MMARLQLVGALLAALAVVMVVAPTVLAGCGGGNNLGSNKGLDNAAYVRAFQRT